MRRRYDLPDTSDPISLIDVDESNEWLMGRLDGEYDEDNDFSLGKEDGLNGKGVAIASEAGETCYKSRSKTQLSHQQSNKKKGKRPCCSISTSFHLIDEDEDQE